MLSFATTLMPTGLGLDSAARPSSSAGAAASGITPDATDKAQGAQRALTTIKQLVTDGRQHTAAKDAARQKLTQLKAQLQNLMMFAGDPNTRAQEAARIAKQIGDAAKEYAQAAGSAADAANPTAATNADIGTTDQAKVAAGSAAAAAPPTAPSPSGKALAASTRSNDQDFINDARLLARRANAVLQSAVRGKPKLSRGIAAEGDKALSAIDNAAFALGLHSGAGIDATAGYAVGATSSTIGMTPVVRVTA